MVGLGESLCRWYTDNHLFYPWRITTDPYRIWLSEILLQQTRISVALKFYDRILQCYPDLKSLAEAKDREFFALWSGIGYYKRAQNMLQCARVIVQVHQGRFPSKLPELLKLPGIGKYTAGAIRNIGFGLLTPAIDANVRRVLSRLTLSHTGLEEHFTKIGRGLPSGDFFQSLMELGERICLPAPLCEACPVLPHCKAYQAGRQRQFPAPAKKKQTQAFHWYLLVLQKKNTHYLAQNRERPFLKNAWIFPDVLSQTKLSPNELKLEFQKQWGIHLRTITEKKVISHAVTFRKISAHVLMAGEFEVNGSNGKWMNPHQLSLHPTSSITSKILSALASVLKNHF